MNNKTEKEQSDKKKTALIITVAVFAVAAVITGSYKVLSKVQAQKQSAENSQEQFVGTVQVSEQLQDECQRSAEKIAAIAEKHDAVKMFVEYREHAESCSEVYFSIETKGNIRSEGSYPDLIVDIAKLAAKTNKAQAVEMLNFAKTLNPWEYYIGPVVCSSTNAIEAYLEAMTSEEEKVCYNAETDREKLVTEIKNKDFAVLSQLAGGKNGVVYVGTLESDSACPDKKSTIMKLIQRAKASNLVFEEVKSSDQQNSMQRFVFKEKDEVKLELDFVSLDNCLRLQTILISEQQTNE